MITLERLRYWQGQLLKSRDFRDQLRYQGQLRAFHNVAMHQAIGIVSGLRVEDGRVTCGFGYDCLGHEVILPKDQAIPARSGTGAELLVLLPPKPGRTSTLAWIDELEWNGNRGLPLARVSGPGLSFDQAYGHAPFVRPLARPRLATGETVRGNTPWEIWRESAVDVGVQTRVDTTAAGFTERPHYFATLKAEKWPLASTPGKPAAEFAPAFFSHVAEATNDAFTFRVLLQDIALRRYELEHVLTRITGLDRGAGTITARVSSAAGLRQGDAVVEVRPRAETASRIEKTEGKTLTVADTLGLKKQDRLVVGNLPRTAVVKQVTAETDTLVLLSSAAGTIPGSIMARVESEGTKGNASRIARIKDGKLLLRDPWSDLAAGQHVHLFHRKDAIKLTASVAEGDTTVITVPADAGLHSGDVVVHLSGKRPAPPSRVTAVETSGTSSKVTLKPAMTELKAGSNVAASRTEVTVDEVEARVGPVEIVLTDDSPFSEHEWLKPQGRTGPPAAVEFSEEAVVRVSAPANWAAEGDTLVAGNLTGALTVENTRVDQGGVVVQVARPSALRTGYAVARVDSDTALSLAATVAMMPGSEFRMDPAIPGLTRFQTLLAIQFPAIVRVAAVNSASEIVVDPSDAIAAGDWLAPVEAVGAFSIVQVAGVNPDGSLRLNGALNAPVDTFIGQVHFRDTAVIDSVDDAAKEIKTETAIAADAAFDFAGAWVFYEDSSSAAVIDQVSGNSLVLRPLTPNSIAGEGLIKSGPFDAGLLAYASVTPQQGHIVLKDSPGLRLKDAVTFSGASSLGAGTTIPMEVTGVDGKTLNLAPKLGGIVYSLRPERSSLVSKFNENFPASFAVFAQKQGLYVAWLGCQHEPRTYPQCGGGSREDPCL